MYLLGGSYRGLEPLEHDPMATKDVKPVSHGWSGGLPTTLVGNENWMPRVSIALRTTLMEDVKLPKMTGYSVGE